MCIRDSYWAFAWAGGQALARYILDHSEQVRGRRVLDFGAGSGLVAIAAMKSGARHVTAAEIDDFAVAAIALNAALNAVIIEIATGDLLASPPASWDTVLIGDMCYERPLAERLTRWLRDAARRGATVLMGDPGRAYLPQEGLSEITRYQVPTPLDLEDRTMREGVIWRLAPG